MEVTAELQAQLKGIKSAQTLVPGYPQLALQALILQNPDGKKEKVYRHSIPNGGDAGYHAIGISRKTFVEQLLKNSNDPTIRSLVAPEIEYMLINGLIDQSLGGELDHNIYGDETNLEEVMKKFFQAKREFENIYLQIVGPKTLLVNISQIAFEAYVDQIKGLSPSASSSLKEAYKKFLQAKTATKKELVALCRTQEVFMAYVRAYISKPGSRLIFFHAMRGEVCTSSLDAIARLNNLNIRIWGKASRRGANTLSYYKICHLPASKKTVDVFFHNNHYDALKSDPNLDLSASVALNPNSGVVSNGCVEDKKRNSDETARNLCQALISDNVNAAKDFLRKEVNLFDALNSEPIALINHPLLGRRNGFRQTLTDFAEIQQAFKDRVLSEVAARALTSLLERDLFTHYYPNKNIKKLITHFSEYTDEEINSGILHSAVKKGDLTGTQLLVEAGVDACIMDKKGKIASEMGRHLKQNKALEYIIPVIEKTNALLENLVLSEVDIPGFLRQNRIHVDQVISYGQMTALLFAAMVNRARVKPLIEAGADPNQIKHIKLPNIDHLVAPLIAPLIGPHVVPPVALHVALPLVALPAVPHADPLRNQAINPLAPAPLHEIKNIDEAIRTLGGKDKIKVAEFLKEKGLDVNQADSEGATALEWGVITRSPNVKELLLLGADPNKKRTVFKFVTATPIAHAILGEVSSLDMVTDLVEGGADVNQDCFFEGCGFGGNEEIDVNLQNLCENHTPLMMAAQRGLISIVRYLLSKGADPWHCRKNGQTALYDAIHAEHFEVVVILLIAMKPLVRLDMECTYLHEAASVGNVKILAAVLAYCRGILNTLNRDGLSPLHITIQKEYPIATALLLKAGASTQILTSQGLSPLSLACRHHRHSFIPLLVQFGVDIRENCSERAVVEYVEKQDNPELVTSLYHAGMDIEPLKSNNPTILKLQSEIAKIKSVVEKSNVCVASYLIPLLTAHREGFSIAFKELANDITDKVGITIGRVDPLKSRLCVMLIDLRLKKTIILDKIFENSNPATILKLPGQKAATVVVNKEGMLARDFEILGKVVFFDVANLELANINVSGFLAVQDVDRLKISGEVNVVGSVELAVNKLEPIKNIFATIIEVHFKGNPNFESLAFLYSKHLTLNLNEGLDITTPLRLTGSLRIAIPPNTRKPLNILADIVLGRMDWNVKQPQLQQAQQQIQQQPQEQAQPPVQHQKPPEPAAADLMIENYGAEINIGSEKIPFINVIASGKVNIYTWAFDLIRGRVVGGDGISIFSFGSNLRVGRMKSPKACGLVSDGKTYLYTGKKIIFEEADNYSRDGFHFEASEEVDCIATQGTTPEATQVDAPMFKLRLLTEYSKGGQTVPIPRGNAHEANKTIRESEKAASDPSYLHVGKELKISGDMEVLGSKIHCGKLIGAAPKVSHFIPFQRYTNNFFCGHEDPGRSRWYNNHKCDFGTPIEGVFSSSSELRVKSSVLDLTGIVFAPFINLEGFNKGNIGLVSVNVALPAPKPFKHIIALGEHLGASPRFDFVGPGFGALFRSVLPLGLKRAYPPAVILNEDGRLSSLKLSQQSLEHLMPYEMQAEVLVKTLLKEFGKGILDEKTVEPELILYKLLLNAQTLLKQVEGMEEDARLLSAVCANLKEPLLVYKEATYNQQVILTPFVIFPSSWNNIRLRDWAGGLFALADIEVQGASRASSSLVITAHIEAGGGVRFSNIATLTHQKNTYTEERVVEDTVSESSWCGLSSSATRTSKVVKTTTAQPGNTLVAKGVKYESIGRLNLNGIEANIGEDGIEAKNLGEISETGIVTSKVKENNVYAGNDGCEIAAHQTLEEHAVHRSQVRSVGAVNFRAGTIHFRSLTLESEREIKLTAEQRLKHGCMVIEEELPIGVGVSRMCHSITTGSTKKGTGVTLLSNGNIECISGGTFHGVGPKIFGRNVVIKAKETSVIEPMRFKVSLSTHMEGMDGFSVVDRDRNERHEVGSAATIIAQENLEMSVTHGNLILVAPVFFAGGEIKLETPNGVVQLKPAVFHHDITTHEFSLGLSFLGSNVIEAAMKRDFRDAAHQLLREFPLLASIEDRLKARDTADKVTSSMKTLFHAYKTYLEFSNAENFKEFLKGQIKPNVKLRFGTESSEQRWTEVALPWLQADKIIMTGKNVSCIGAQGSCQKLKIHAEKNVELSAAQRSSSMNSSAAGMTLGIYPLSAGVDYSWSEREAQEFITSRFNVSGLTTIVAGEQLSLKGVYIETLKAVLKAETAHYETLQNKSRAVNFSAFVSTDGSFGVSSGFHDKDWASVQTGVHAQETLLMDIRKHITMIGSKLTVGNEAKPLHAQLPDGNTMEFYEYELPLEDGLAIALKLDQEMIVSSLADKALETELRSWFVYMIFTNTLPVAFQDEQTRTWHRHYVSKSLAPNFSDQLRAYTDKTKLSRFLLLLLSNSNFIPAVKFNYAARGKIELIAKIAGARIQVWEICSSVPNKGDPSKGVPSNSAPKDAASSNDVSNKDVLKLKYSTKHAQSPVPKREINLRLTSVPGKLSRWSLLHTQPGLVCAAEIRGQTVVNREEGQQFGVNASMNPLGSGSAIKGVGGVDYRAVSAGEKLKATISANVAVDCASVAGINRNESAAREKTKEEQTHIGVFAPLGNPLAIAKEVRHVVAATPNMFKPKEPELPPLQGPGVEMKIFNEQRIRERANRANQDNVPLLFLTRSPLMKDARGAPRITLAKTEPKPASPAKGPERRLSPNEARKSQYYKEAVKGLVVEQSMQALKKRGYQIPERTLVKLAEKQVSRFLSGTKEEMSATLVKLGNNDAHPKRFDRFQPQGARPNAGSGSGSGAGSSSHSAKAAKPGNANNNSPSHGVAKLVANLVDFIIPAAHAGEGSDLRMRSKDSRNGSYEVPVDVVFPTKELAKTRKPAEPKRSIFERRARVMTEAFGEHYEIQQEIAHAKMLGGAMVGYGKIFFDGALGFGGALADMAILNTDNPLVTQSPAYVRAEQRHQQRVQGHINVVAHPIDALVDLKSGLANRFNFVHSLYASGQHFSAGVAAGEVVGIVHGGVGASGLLGKMALNNVPDGLRCANKGVLSAYNRSKDVLSNFDVLEAYNLRSPVTFQFEPNKLYSGLPFDAIKPQVPWQKKDLLSSKARGFPTPLLEHELAMLNRWTGERKIILEKWKLQDISILNDKMYRLMDKSYKTLRDHMTPDDLAALFKEQRNVKIIKPDGELYTHEKEWRSAKLSLKNALQSPWVDPLLKSEPLTTKQIELINERLSDLSRLLDRYNSLQSQAQNATKGEFLKP